MGSSSWPRSTIKGVLIVKEEGGSSSWPRSTIKGVLLVEEEEQKAPLDSINRSGPVRLGQFSIDSFGTEGIVTSMSRNRRDQNIGGSHYTKSVLTRRSDVWIPLAK